MDLRHRLRPGLRHVDFGHIVPSRRDMPRGLRRRLGGNDRENADVVVVDEFDIVAGIESVFVRVAPLLLDIDIVRRIRPHELRRRERTERERISTRLVRYGRLRIVRQLLHGIDREGGPGRVRRARRVAVGTMVSLRVAPWLMISVRSSFVDCGSREGKMEGGIIIYIIIPTIFSMEGGAFRPPSYCCSP